MRKSLFALVLVLLIAGAPASAQRMRINLGTVAPERSVWYEALERIRQQWRQISGGSTDVRLFGGGKLGDDPEMLRKMRIGQLQAVAFSGVGLSRIDNSIDALQIPLMFRSYEELDYVLERIRPTVERRFEEKGYIVLNLVEAGWVHFFSKDPIRSVDDLRNSKLWITAGDPETAKLYAKFGIQTTALPMTDMLTSLQTGLITAIQVPPLFALADGSYTRAPYMTALRWAIVMGGAVISKKTWARIPEQHRREMAAAAETTGAQLRTRTRKMEAEAIEEMKKRGLNVVDLTAAERERWQHEARQAYPELRGTMAPAEMFDQVQRLRDEYRGKQPGG